MPETQPENKGPGNGSLIRQLIDLLSNIVLDTPDHPAELLWRVFSIFCLSSIFISGFLVWRHPEVVTQMLTRAEPSPLLTDRLTEKPELKTEVMKHVSSFIHHNRPSKLALVSWPTATTGSVVWDSGDAQFWPVKLNGLYSLNLVPAVGPMVFKECWIGQFGSSPNWLLCPIHDDTDVWGFVITQWQATPTPIQKRSLRHLTERLESLIY